jgi:hypothetical protein
MVNQETDKGKRAAFWARMSVEAIVVILVAAATVGIFTVQILAGGWEDPGSPGPSKVVRLRHDAISEASPSDTAQNVATAAVDQSKEPSNDTVVRNGVTVVSPPLLVPVISDDAIQMATGSDVLTLPHKAPSARKRSHYTSRAHTRGQRRVVRSAPFWRLVAR